jgi:hypothetical protein
VVQQTLYHDRVLLEYGTQNFMVLTPFHSELQAMHLVVESLMRSDNPKAIILTDCLELKKMLVFVMPPLDINWRLYTLGMKI